MLAWLRTGLTIIAIGFVISRFGLFIHLLDIQEPAANHIAQEAAAAMLGIAFVLIGSLTIALSALQHRRFVATLPATSLPVGYSNKLMLLLSAATAILGIILATYLWIS